MRHSIRKEIRRFLCFSIAVIMILTSMPVHSLAAEVNYNDLSYNKNKIINNKTPVTVAKLKESEKAKDLIENPAQPDIYTLRTDFRAEKGEGYKVNYQPYVASVGKAASDAEKDKVNKEIKLPDMAGYDKPVGEKTIKIKYDNIKKLAKHKTGDEKNGYKFLGIQDKNYTAKTNSVVIKHVFQDMHDFNKFINRKTNTITEEKTEEKEVNGVKTYVKMGYVYNRKADGNFPDTPDEKYDLSNPDQKAEFLKYEETTINNGNTGSTLEVQALQENQRPGFVPQVEKLKTQVPEDTSEFRIEYRYNRAHYNVAFDCQDGTPLPTRSYYYDQEIPKIDEKSIPKKKGCEFLGWKPSHNLESVDGTKTYKKGEIIKDDKGNASSIWVTHTTRKTTKANLYLIMMSKYKEQSGKEIKLKMPALALGDGKNIPREKLTFTAVWKDKEKADFAIQFWAEKADHADKASLADKYEYMGTKVYKDIDVGFQPYLEDIPINGIKFPDLDQGRLDKIWAKVRFNRGHDLYLNKFFVYNKKLTDDQNLDSKTNVTKTVSATGKTVYNIYYDRQVYDLYFTKSNAQLAKNTIYPEIWGYDPAKGESVMLGGPGKLYHYKARFNEMMYKWPNDAKQTKGFTPGYQSFGWGPNYTKANWPLHLDTPPYRLNADEFLDMENYTSWGGYIKHIDKGDGTTKDLDSFDFTTLSFGIKQDKPSIPHHMDFWMDGFKKDETIIRYDLVRTKADTSDPDYGHRYPLVTGFTPYGYEPMKAWPVIKEGSEENGRVDEEGINDLNDKRDDITLNTCGTYYNNNGIKLPIGQLDFIPYFYSDSDEFGDVKEGGQEFTENGYLQFKYKRNKYPLRFNYDPSNIKGDSEFGKTNSIDTFYEFPLACLSPDLIDGKKVKKEDREYFKKDPKSLIDIPENLQKMGLTDLVVKDEKTGKWKIRRPDGVSDQSVFKGWALDPAGTKLVWKNKGEKMPSHPLNLYAIWGEPDYKWKVTIDPNGGKLPIISADNITTAKKTIKEGEAEKEKESTYPVAGFEGKNLPTGDDDKDKSNTQVFTVVQRQKLNNLPKPERYGYDFLGWEVVRYKKDKDDNDKYTDEVDNSYRERYKVPELYTFGEDVVSPITLKAIWVENKRAEVKVKHYKLTKDLKIDKSIYPNPQENTLEYKRVGDYVPATAEKQDENWILATHDELMEKLPKDLKAEYIKYNNRVKMNNTFFQTFRVADNINVGTADKPVYKPSDDNEFIFFYRPFRTRNYKVNYLDERGKKEIEKFYEDLALQKTAGLTGEDLIKAQEANKKKFKDGEENLNAILDKYKIVDQEKVVSKCRHFDARNYRPIPGWKLTSDPQQQLFYDVNEDTNEFLGINGTSGDQIFFYYKDARVIEVPKDGKTPDGYVRVTFKADKGGSFGKDKDGKDIKELNYDVIKGLKSDLLPVPQELKDGEKKVADKYYITPETGRKFTKWDNSSLLNKNTIIDENHTFTAYFEWSGLSATGLVRTEAFEDDKKEGTKDWSNNFAPTIEELKKQLVWREKDQAKDLPTGAKIQLFDENDNELITNNQVYDLVTEKKAADKDELVRTVNVKAKVTFKDGKEPQELTIPITVYKNVYEALNKDGDKPLFLKEAEGKEAKDGGLKDVTGNYVKVTIKASKDFNAKDDKIYYVNKNAWVKIPEVKTEGSSTFVNWTADKAAQNEENKENGIFDFGKRHKFTEDTVISPSDAKDVVEQTDPKKKPDVPNSFVKVIVKTTDKATDETKFEKTFWVNPTKEVNLGVANPTGKEKQKVTIEGLGEKEVNYVFKEWQKIKAGEADDKLAEVKPVAKIDLAKNKFTDKVTVIEAYYNERFAAIPIGKPIKTDELHTPEGKEITDKDLIGKITPPKNKEIESITVVEKPDPSKPGKQEAKVTIKYKDGTTQGTNDKPVIIPVEVHKNIIPEAPGGQRPKDALDNYVKVIFKAGKGGKLEGKLVYYVSPEVEVDMAESAGNITKTPEVGYVSGNWDTSETKKLKATFTAKETEFTFNFTKTADIVEKTNENPNKPDGYVTVTFKTEDESKGKLDGNVKEKIYYVNPKAGITLKVLGKNETATDKQLAVPKPTANDNFTFKEWQEAIDEKTPITGNREYVAMFENGQVTLTYDAGGATGDVPGKATIKVGRSLRLANLGNLKKENATFAGWKIGEKTYQIGDEVTLTENTTATAQWTTDKHKVTFDTKGGSEAPATQEVEHGKTATEPTTKPTLDGKVFMGWKENASDTNYFDFAKTAITADKTLIAIWQDPVQKINDGDLVEEQFIKVTFLKGAHGTLKDGQASNLEKVTYKVAKGMKLEDAKGIVPEIVPEKYYKSKSENDGWDKALDLTLATGETEKVFTAQYEPKEDVIPVEPGTSDEDIKKEIPDEMILVEFVVPKDKAFMTGNTKFYVKRDKLVDIETPVVHPLTLADGKENDYEFKGWNFKKDSTGKYLFKFKQNTQIGDGNFVKPEITIRDPKPNAKNVIIKDLTAQATGYLEIYRGTNPPVYVESSSRGRLNLFKIPDELGGKLDKNDRIRIYSKLNGVESDIREYRVR